VWISLCPMNVLVSMIASVHQFCIVLTYGWIVDMFYL